MVRKLKSRFKRFVKRSKGKIRRTRYRIVMKHRFLLDGYYKYGDPNRSFIRKGIYLVLLVFAYFLNVKSSSTPNRGEINKYTTKPCISGAESSFSRRHSYTFIAKRMLLYDIISFDVFDTLILRPFDDPKSVFFLLGEIHKCPSFKRYRILAEKQARAEAFEKNGNYEVTLKDIYEKMSRYVVLDVDKAVELEIEVELSLVYANPYMKEVFLEAKNLGKKIIAVSDMYLSSQVIKKMLQKCGYEGFDDVIVSVEHGCSKRSRELYSVVKERYGEDSKILHIGDNPVSDLRSARASGIATLFYKNVNSRGNYHRAFDMTSLIGSGYRGVVNSKLQNGNKVYTPFYEYGYTYSGFLTLGYCHYIHEFVKNNNIDKVLFLSRDGYILKKIYDKLYPSADTSYVYWSRSAATKLTVNKFRNELLLRYIKYKIPRQMTLMKILRALDMDQMSKPLSDAGFTPNTILTKDNYEDIVAVFIKNWDIIVKAYEKNSLAAKMYYEQELSGCKSACIVDIGWAASGYSALRYLIEDEWKLGCKTYGLVAGSTYLHDMDIIEPQLASGVVSSYMFSQRINREIRREHNVKQMYGVFTEIMLSAPVPSFIGFDLDENGEVKFEFDTPEVEGYEMIKDIQRGAEEFVNDYTAAFKDYPYMINIPGCDAYAVCKQVISHHEYFKNLFADYPVNRAVGSASFEFGTLDKLIENEFIK